MVPYERLSAFTLIELMITLVIAGVLMSVAVPAMKNFLGRNKARHEIQQLSMALRSARSHAIFHQQAVIVCPKDRSGKCHKNWNRDIHVFIDSNNNRKYDNDERILTIIKAVNKSFSLRSFPRNMLRFTYRGFSNTGSLTYCANTHPIQSVVMIFSRMGRMRPGNDKNNNGIQENPKGIDAPCPA